MNVTTAPAEGLRPSTESDSPCCEDPGDSTSRSNDADSQDPDNPPEPPPPEPGDADQRPTTGPRNDSARRGSGGEPAIDVNDDRAAGLAVSTEWIERHLRAAAPHIDQPVARVSVRLIDDPAMAELHERIGGERATTDVLTFDSSEPNGPIEADIAVCVDVARREAEQRGHGVERELLLYTLHGVLHCAGHDDHDQARWQAMHDAEDRILNAIGVGATFHGESNAQNENNTR